MDEHSPELLTSLSGITSVTGGGIHSLALKSDGTVWAWGSNSSGQLGNGTTTSSLIPIMVNSLTGVVSIAAGGVSSIALKGDGTLLSWGYNPNGELGDGTTTNRNVPVPVNVVTGISSIATGADHSLAIKSDGSYWSWGLNAYGQLGDGTNTNRLSPVTIHTSCSITTGIKTNDENNTFSVVPNPTNGNFIYQFNGDKLSGNTNQITIYNLVGEKVYESITPEMNNETVDITNQSAGIYFISLRNGNKMYTEKFIKQ